MRRICPRRLCRRGAGRGPIRGPCAVTNASMDFFTVELRARCDAFAAEHGPGWKESLPAGPLVFVIVDELERAFPQLQHCNVGGHTHLQRPVPAEDLKRACGIDG